MHIRYLLSLFIVLAYTLAGEKSYAQSYHNKFQVGYHKNIESYFLAELLAVRYRQTNQQWEAYKLKECRSYQPIVDRALRYFQDSKYELLGTRTAAFVDTLIIKYGYGNDIMMPVLLDQPSFDLRKPPHIYRFSIPGMTQQKKDSLEKFVFNYLQFLYGAFHSMKINRFFEQNESFYKGAKKEVSSLIPKGFTQAMETYYGESRSSYVALVSPMMIWPIEEHEGRGISATIARENQQIVYEVMSPYVRVPIDSTNRYLRFGYDYEPTAKFLTVHEFGHSFVNEPVGRYKDRIERTAFLFTDKLKERMASKGINNWNTYVIETFVRLGELRIAALQGDKAREERLRTYHTKSEYFIFLPLLEQKVAVFEQQRAIYPTWSDYIPELLKVFEESSVGFVEKACSGV